MTGENQSAKVAASRVLMDALVEEHEERDRTRELDRMAPFVRARLDKLIEREAKALTTERTAELERELADVRAELAEFTTVPAA